MKARFLLTLFFLLALAGFSTQAVHADGIVIPQPPICDPEQCPPLPLPMAQLDIRFHHVTVRIEDQVAVTHVDQVFYNPNDWTVEGTYIFPLPTDAAVTGFTLWIDGEPVQGEVLDASQARQKYEEIVRSLRDPALLEYADRGAVQASIFPIPPEGERRIELEYTQALTADNGLVRYTYPLNTEKFSLTPLESVSVSVEVRSPEAIRAAYSPTHSVDITRHDDHHLTAGYEANDVKPDQDFALYYSIGESEAFHLLTYRDPLDGSDPDGFFLLLLAPRPDVETAALPKDLILVLDRSGSMEGEKFLQAQEALRYVLRHLNPEDRFNVISFSTGLESYAQSLRPAGEASSAEAWVDGLNAQGSTDINRALLEAASMSDSERPTYIIFLTDGLPTEGETNSQKILDNFSTAAPASVRLFAFGVGYDVDTFLLDSLAQGHHGASTYVRPGDALDEILSTFYAKVSTPVLTDLELDFGSLAAYDIYPSPLPDLFRGSQIVAVGRYRQGGTADIALTGQVNGENHTFRYPDQAFASDSREDTGSVLTSLPRLWATRKIGYLLNQIRLDGPDEETIDQIVRLSIRYGIVTPYTSYLVTEPMPLGGEAQNRIAEEQFHQALATPELTTGQEAVEKAAGQADLAGAEAPAAAPAEAAEQLRIVGSRTFVLSGEVWTETTYDPETMTPMRVPFLSEDFFALSQARPDLAPILAIGQQVIFLDGGQAFVVVPEDQPGDSIQIQQATDVPPADSPTPAGGESTSLPPAPRPTEGTRSEDGGTSGMCPGLILPVSLVFGVAIMRQRRKG
jgi:Ca-activated chloride channel family protein